MENLPDTTYLFLAVQLVYMITSVAFIITTIVQCWSNGRVAPKSKQIIWTIVILLLVPAVPLGSILFSLFYYKGWNKIVPLGIFIVLGFGLALQFSKMLDDWDGNLASGYTEQVLIEREINPQLYQWSEDSALKALNLEAKDFKQQLETIRELFTDVGYAGYYRALQQSKTLYFLESREFDRMTFVLSDKASTKAYKTSPVDGVGGLVVVVSGQRLFFRGEQVRKQNVTLNLYVTKQAESLKMTNIVVIQTQN